MSTVFTFDSIVEDKESLTVFMWTPDGVLTSATFGDIDSHEEYRIVSVGQGGRHYEGAPDHVVWFMLLKHGAPAQRIMQFTDDPESGLLTSHHVTVSAPKERASALAHAAIQFMKGTRWQLEHLYRVPKLTAITYDTDAFIISYDLYDTLKLGLTTAHRRLLTRYDRDFFETDLGFTCMRFWFVDEVGDGLDLKFLVPTEHIQRIAVELNLFMAAFEEQHNPKAEAALPACIFQYAAYAA